MTTAQPREASDRLPIDALGLFAMAWAGQTIVQLTWISDWIHTFHPVGWIAFFLAIAVLIWPGNLRLFIAAVTAATIHYLTKWPFVLNHQGMDGFMSLVMLSAAVIMFGPKLIGTTPIARAERDAYIDRFRPVLIAMFVLMYYIIALSKLNWDFFDPATSCMQAMYEHFLHNRSELIRDFAGLFSTDFLFAFFIVLEIILPVMLMFRRTRLLAVYMGLPFHLLLGIMGHFSYSSIVGALYILVALPSIMEALPLVIERIGQARVRALALGFRVYAVVIAGLFVLAPFTTSSVDPFDPVVGSEVRMINWIIVACLVSLLIAGSVLRTHLKYGPLTMTHTGSLLTSKPGWVWVFALAMTFHSLSPYMGLKTSPVIAMYSNLRTEAGQNNHMFMPTYPLFSYTSDLIEVVDSNNPEVAKLKFQPFLFRERETDPLPTYRTYFDFRRTISQIKDDNLRITYLRNGELRTFVKGAPDNQDSDLDQPLPFLERKFANFRPVFKDRSYCTM